MTLTITIRKNVTPSFQILVILILNALVHLALMGPFMQYMRYFLNDPQLLFIGVKHGHIECDYDSMWQFARRFYLLLSVCFGVICTLSIPFVTFPFLFRQPLGERFSGIPIDIRQVGPFDGTWHVTTR